jgi:hypothetical protein
MGRIGPLGRLEIHHAGPFLLQNPVCWRSIIMEKPHHATQIHHKRGRLGALLTNGLYFVPVCQDCHHWISTHPDEARSLNLLCEKGMWHKQ